MRAVIVVRYTVPGSTGSSSGTATSVHRVKVPMHHDFKAAYFQALCAAFFIMDAGDVERVKKIVEDSGRKWSNTMAFNFRYIAQLVRRKVPSPAVVLHSRLEAVFDFFKDQKDTKN